jgi:hypothetical protein
LTALTTDFERESAFDHAFDRAADVQWQRHHRRDAVEKKNPFDQHLGVLHLGDRLSLDVPGELVIAPVLAGFGVQEYSLIAVISSRTVLFSSDRTFGLPFINAPYP